MKRAFIISAIAIAVLIVSGVVILCLKMSGVHGSNPPETENPKKNAEPLDFQSFTIKENNSSAIVEVMSAEKTEDGIRLVRSYENMSDDEITVIREINGDAGLLADVQKTLGEYGVEAWDGFYGKNPPDVLDGTSMSFECTMSDGSIISASGSNNFPENYGAVYSYIFDILYCETISTTEFEGKCYKLTLPESWVGKVKVTYQEDYNAFVIPIGDRDVQLMRVDFRTYELNNEKGVTDIGTVKSADSDEIIFLSVLDYGSFMKPDEGTEEQYALYESFESDLEAIIGSIMLTNGYEFVTEEG